MNMEDKKWNQFWDEEPHDEDADDDYNDIDSDIDVNNRETFGNTEEWNEEEHEELIARDQISSRSTRHNDRNQHNNNNNVNNNHNNVNNNRHHNNRNHDRTPLNNNANHTDNDKLRHTFNNTLENNMLGDATRIRSAANIAHMIGETTRGGWQPMVERDPFSSQRPDRMMMHQQQQQLHDHKHTSQPGPSQATFGDASWQMSPDRLRLLQLQQQQVILQNKIRIEEEMRLRNQLAAAAAAAAAATAANQKENQSTSRIGQSSEASVVSANKSEPTFHPKVMSVEELEKQLVRAQIDENRQSLRAAGGIVEPPKRSGWSPFGGKDLFNADADPAKLQESMNFMLNPTGATPESIALLNSLQQQDLLRLYYLEQQQHQRRLLEQRERERLQQLAALNQQEATIKTQKAAPQCITVEELERQMLAASRPAKQPEAKRPIETAFLASAQSEDIRPKPLNPSKPNRESSPPQAYINFVGAVSRGLPQTKSQLSTERSILHRAPIDKHDEASNQNEECRRDKHNRERDSHHNDHKDNRGHDRGSRSHNNNLKYEHRERHERDRGHREHQHNHPRARASRKLAIIPPQVQLDVLKAAKAEHCKASPAPDECLQDTLPGGAGFKYKKQSELRDQKPVHDGILTTRERDWLTRIQEKIQSDYDDNLDQDYYYLLYFNRITSSMTDKTAQQKPGVLDRRFIPRERLLYNTNTMN